VNPRFVIILLLRTLEIRLRQWTGRPPRPYKILLELTDTCNSRCLTCSIWKHEEGHRKGQFSLDTAHRLFASYGKNLLWIALSGGEVTTYRDFQKLVEIIKTLCPNLKLITFTTNGLLPDRALECARQLRTLASELFVTISLDGDESTHDKIRGVPGNYQKAKKTYQLLQSEKITTHWGITLSEFNKDFILQPENSLLTEIKAVTFAHSDGLYRQKNDRKTESLVPMLKRVILTYKFNNLSELFEWIYIRLSLRFVVRNYRIPIPCEVISTSVHVKSNGKVHPCMFVDEIGDLESKPLSEILQDPQLALKTKAYRQGQCPQCWMNCYAPHSMLQHPLKTLLQAFSLTRP
jgi:MoaA/NifB/PqqE/SkfB family radical SAM enzyme